MEYVGKEWKQKSRTLEMEDVQKTEMFESVKEYLMQSRLLNDGKVNYEYHHMGKDLDN